MGNVSENCILLGHQTGPGPHDSSGLTPVWAGI